LPYGFLTKPFKSRDLQATLTMALRKSAADAGMQRSNGLMNMTMHATHEAIVFVAADGVIEFMNQPAEQMSGLKLLRARGMLFSEVFNLIEIDARPIPLPANSGNSASIEEFGWFLWVPGRDPLIVDFTIRPVVAYGGSLGGNVVTLRNAAQRMRKSLIEASTKETACFDNAPMSMVQLDGEGHVLRVNQMLLKESGLPMELLVGRSLTDLLADHDPRITRQFISRLLRPFPPAQCLSA
jgi:PAS domain-containing protein